MLSHLRHWPQHLLPRLAAALPTSCAICGCDARHALCDGCCVQFFARDRRRCVRCAIPLSEHTSMPDTTCGACLKQPPAFDATIVATDYVPPVDQLVLALKFGSRLELAPLLASLLHDALQRMQSLTLPTRLLAVPLGPQRLVERGFNQALEIAKPLSRALGVGCDARLVVRQRDTRAQALLHPDERHRNMRNAFVVPAEAISRVHGQHIGLIDDVMTTGETLNALAATLKRFGAARVTNLVFARTAQ